MVSWALAFDLSAMSAVPGMQRQSSANSNDPERVYRLPLGCASEPSCLGFALAYRELREQMREHGRTVGTIGHASSLGGTHAGLALHGFEREIRGIVVAGDV